MRDLLHPLERNKLSFAHELRCRLKLFGIQEFHDLHEQTSRVESYIEHVDYVD